MREVTGEVQVELVVVYVGLLCSLPVCAWLERRAPTRRSSERRLDAAYWLLTPLLTGVLTRSATLGAYALLGSLAGSTLDPGFALISSSARALRALPFALQLSLALLLGDGVGYWSHRLRHLFWWRFHQIHHAPQRLVATSAARLHPLDELLDGLLIGLALLVAGFDWRVFAWVGPVTLLYTLVSHLAVDASFGPLGLLLVSPRFHRFHHALRRARPGVNFAGMFPLWDWMFGTYHMPHAQCAEPLGVEQSVPESLRAQLLLPFAARAPSAGSP